MTERDRRAVIVGLVVVGAAVTLRGIPTMTRRFNALHRTALERQATLERTRAILATRLADRDSFEHVVAGILGLSPHLLDGATTADAQASLSGLLSLAAGRHGVRVLRIDPVEVADSGESVFGRATVHAEVESDIAGMLKLVRALETSDPLLTISSLEIAGPSVPIPQGQAEALRGEVTVTGYYLARNAR